MLRHTFLACASALCLSLPATAQGFSMGSYGSGCPGTQGIPSTCAFLDAQGLQIYLHAGLLETPVFLVVGGERRAVNLGGGCTLWVRPDVVIPAFSSLQGTVYWQLPSPLNMLPSWRGQDVHFQHVVVDPGGLGLGGGFAVTNGFGLSFF